MKLSFVIPAHNEENYLRPCLESVLSEAAKQDWTYEILVVDNASTDGTRALAQSFANVRVVSEPIKGLTRARERGFREAQGEILAYIDADSRLSQNWFAILKDSFENPGLVCLSGPYRYYDLSRIRRFFAELGWRLFAPATYRLVGYMVLGGNFAVKREVLERMGGFNTEILFYGEDTDIAWRLSRLGKVRFRMDFFVWSSGRRLSAEGLIKSYFVYGLNFLWGVLFHRPLTKRYKDVR